jgi:hypothetical protein
VSFSGDKSEGTVPLTAQHYCIHSCINRKADSKTREKETSNTKRDCIGKGFKKKYSVEVYLKLSTATQVKK